MTDGSIRKAHVGKCPKCPIYTHPAVHVTHAM
jgi:hypothetical protein